MAMTIATDYTKQAEEFLAMHGLTFAVTLVGSDCPRFCDDARKGIAMDKINTFPRRTHIHGKHYLCTITRSCNAPNAPASVSFDFWNSYADEEQNAIVRANTPIWHINNMSSESAALVRKYKGKRLTKVTAYDLLAVITKSDPGDFEQFCSDFSYDTDSRSAEDAWRAVVKEWKKVERFFAAEELEQLQEVQ